MIPNKLDEWSFEIIQELVQKQANESDRHDFKKDLREAYPENITKICCAFANTKGGFIVFGIKDNDKNWRIDGIENSKELAHDFGKKIKANPTIDYNLPKIINIPQSDKVIAIFEIPLSTARPHLPDNSAQNRIFYKRTNQGNYYMTYDEIKFSFQDYQERREKIQLLYIELLSNIEYLDSMKMADDKKNTNVSLLDLNSYVINNLLVELYSSISKEKKLIELLFDIRKNIIILNTKNKMLISHLGNSFSDKKILSSEHNQFIDKLALDLKPKIQEALNILENKFDFKNPLQ